MKPIQVFVLAAAVIALPVFIVYAGAALTPFILAAVLAYILAPLAAKIEKYQMPPAAAAAICVILILAVLVALPLAVVPLVAEQINKLAAFLPSAAANAAKWLGGAHPQLLAQLKLLAPADVAEVAGLVDGSQALQTANFAAGVFGKGLSAALSFLAALVLTPLVAFYFIRDRSAIGGELIAALPPGRRPAILDIVADLNGVLGEFLRGQLLVIIIMAVLYSAILHFTDVPFALAIGVIAMRPAKPFGGIGGGGRQKRRQLVYLLCDQRHNRQRQCNQHGENQNHTNGGGSGGRHLIFFYLCRQRREDICQHGGENKRRQCRTGINDKNRQRDDGGSEDENLNRFHCGKMVILHYDRRRKILQRRS